ncbi:MAG: tetratricopeptide repeat protein [Nodosilinea sp.]
MTFECSSTYRPTLVLTGEPPEPWPSDPSRLAEAQAMAYNYQQSLGTEAFQELKQGLRHFRQGQYPTALNRLQQALKSYRSLGDRSREMKVLMILATLYYRLADYLWAADYGRQCLNRARELGDAELMQQALGHLGNSYRHLGDLQKALEYMTQSLNLAKKMGDQPGEMRSLNNLAMVYRAKGLTRQAATLYEASLLIGKTLGDDIVHLQILQNLGNTYLTLREYPQAIECYENFLSLSQGLGQGGASGVTDNYTRRRILTQLTTASLAINDHNRAILHLQQHLTIACAQGDTRGAATLIDDLSRSYAALNLTQGQ